MLTRQGRLTLLAAGALFVVGRMVGSVELYVFGAVLVALVGVTLAGVLATRIRIEVARELHPPRVHAGTPSRVDVRVHNRGGGRSPLLSLHDAVSGTRGARLLVGPLAPGESARAAYRLPTERRGILTIGPLEVELSDPFGMARLTMTASGASELTVYPHVDELDPLPMTTGNDPLAGAEHPNSLGRGGEDFYALRDYVVGDDLRRVHWPSTARHDDLMVRQDELPWQGRATVLVDVRASSNTVESLELVISAAASIVASSARRQDLVRLVSTDGADSGFAAGHAHIEAIMEHLAAIEATNDAAFQRVLDRLARGAPGGALVVVVARVGQAELERLARLRPRFGSLTIVQFDRSSWDPSAPPAGGPDRAGVLRITGAATFAATWNRSVRPTRRTSTAWRPPAKAPVTAASKPGDGGDDWDRWARFPR
ncbi:MAG TPA: DUF58 domain-containing protein [Acidimicrobiales bacterium]|nr:DUF58 domain-containing protein [Acidimicrobiales bacterium]